MYSVHVYMGVYIYYMYIADACSKLEFRLRCIYDIEYNVQHYMYIKLARIVHVLYSHLFPAPLVYLQGHVGLLWFE